MCAHYESISDPKRIAEYFQVEMPEGAKTDVWPAYQSILIRRPKEAGSGVDAVSEREAITAEFGLIPHWAKERNKGRRNTYNARVETVAELPSFKDAWRLARHCIIPAEAIYEPDHRSGKAVSTRISRADGKPMGIAGIWTGNKKISGEVIRSYAMLTINADDHPLMNQFHRKEEEKRMVVILNDEDYDAWLSAPVERSMEFMRQYPAEKLVAVPAKG